MKMRIVSLEKHCVAKGLCAARLRPKSTPRTAVVERVSGGHLLALQMVDDHEELLSNSVARLERVRHKHERLSKILISVKAGVEHLQDKLKSTATEVCVSSPSSVASALDVENATRPGAWLHTRACLLPSKNISTVQHAEFR